MMNQLWGGVPQDYASRTGSWIGCVATAWHGHEVSMTLVDGKHRLVYDGVNPWVRLVVQVGSSWGGSWASWPRWVDWWAVVREEGVEPLHERSRPCMEKKKERRGGTWQIRPEKVLKFENGFLFS
jgi:hypothetical protein